MPHIPKLTLKQETFLRHALRFESPLSDSKCTRKDAHNRKYYFTAISKLFNLRGGRESLLKRAAHTGLYYRNFENRIKLLALNLVEITPHTEEITAKRFTQKRSEV